MAKNKKIYSVKEKFEYHRLRSSQISKIDIKSRCYSSGWCDGFTDTHPRQNLSAVNNEINYVKKNIKNSKEKSIKLADLNGYRNGLMAQIKK